MLDLLDRLVTDTKIQSRLRRSHSSPYAQALSEQLQREEGSHSPPRAAEGGQIPPRTPALPRTLRLITTETFCENCGAHYRVPCSGLIVEYDTSSIVSFKNKPSFTNVLKDSAEITKILTLCHAHGHRPLNEHQTVHANVPACEACFAASP